MIQFCKKSSFFVCKSVFFMVVSEKSVHSVPEHAEKNMINLYFGQFLIFFCVSYLLL